jgi:hypoxanthine-guanine phosphoribosyltransferase
MMTDDVTELKVDVGILKTQVITLTSLCQKMDQVIEKLVMQQERYTTQIYKEMEQKRMEKNAEIKDIHDRIDTVIDKVQITELRIMEEIKELRAEIAKNNQTEKDSLDKINQYKWMLAGGIIVLSWLISHVNSDTIAKLLHG